MPDQPGRPGRMGLGSRCLEEPSLSPAPLDEAGSGPGTRHIRPLVPHLGPRAVAQRLAAGMEVTRSWVLARALPENGGQPHQCPLMPWPESIYTQGWLSTAVVST